MWKCSLFPFRRLLSTHYDVLNVPRDASSNQIKKAFFEIAKKYHPDTNKDPEAPKKFIEAKRAYDTLADPEKRKMYDMTGSDDQVGGAQQDDVNSGSYDFKDFYNNFANFDFFNELFQDSRSRDIELAYNIDFLEAARGATKTISYDKLSPCVSCNGKGYIQSSRAVCAKCKGSGHITEIRGGFIFSSTCKACNGSGRSQKDRCKTCMGEAFAKTTCRINVSFPSGIPFFIFRP